MTSPGAGEARLELTLDGHTITTRSLAIGPQSVTQRLSEALPQLAASLATTLQRQLAAEMKQKEQENV